MVPSFRRSLRRGLLRSTIVTPCNDFPIGKQIPERLQADVNRQDLLNRKKQAAKPLGLPKSERKCKPHTHQSGYLLVVP